MDPYNYGHPQGNPNMPGRMGMGLPALNPGMPMMPDLGLGFDSSNYMQPGSFMPGMHPLQPPTMPAAMTPASTTSSQSPAAATSASAAKGKKGAASKKRKAPASDTQSNPDAPDSPSSGTGTATAADSEEMRKARRREQIAKAARKHRQRQKDELVALREKVKDLKEQIEVLQSSEPSEHDTESGWKQEAEQHAEIRARVDQENEFLRKTLMEQMKFIQRLQDYFTKQPLLNAPSLNKMLTTTPTTSMTPPPAPALMPPPSMPSSFFQLPTVSFRDSLIKLADEAVNVCMESVQYGEQLFKQPKVANMSYLGVTVQYEMNKDNIHIFLRHVLPGANYMSVSDRVWDLLTCKNFNQDFPFTESYEVLDAIDNDTKYIRAILNLTLPNPDKNGSTKVKAERLHVVKRRSMANCAYIASRSVNDDPSWPQTPSFIRRHQNIGIMLRECTEEGRSSTEIMWCIKVHLDQHTDSSIAANAPDTILRNLFEVTPPFFKAVLDRVQQ
ncbi:hypothetical protein THRCLA_02425 [Thraustotheca clavata]|uniref:BZIP domain-containing protein n=1 Tax=Thraustotheca clavata TaxID=74557 RepID=A0A1W0A586_9STRA|nr:hypothetical protein THRCLA_02425 [Thraustotheca clavata]